MGSSSPIRIAVLEADNPPPQAARKYGSYGGLFTSLIHRAADASKIPRSQLELSGWDVCHIFDEDWAAKGEIEEDVGGMYHWKRRREYPNLDAVDAILITGSSMWVLLAKVLVKHHGRKKAISKEEEKAERCEGGMVERANRVWSLTVSSFHRIQLL